MGLDWSLDGEWFVFHTASIPRYLFKINVRGDSLVRLSGADSPNPDLEDTVAGRWSLSGDRILYAVSAGKPRGVSMMNLDGSGARILILYGVMPNWFPNGESIVYVNWDTTVEEGRRRQIHRARADGAEIEKLTDLLDSGIINYPSVSLDGAHIAFVYRAEDQSAEVFLMRADGTDIRQVTQGPGIARSPEWHPNGEKILFERFIPNVSHHLYLLDVETLEVEPVFLTSSD